MSFERKTTAKFIAPVFVAILGLTACGSESEPKTTPAQETETSSTGNSGDFKIYYEYTPTGKRTTTFSGPQDDGGWNKYPEKIAYCEGLDFVEDTLITRYNSGAAGASSERIESHPACEDGKLTPEDFRISG